MTRKLVYTIVNFNSFVVSTIANRTARYIQIFYASDLIRIFWHQKIMGIKQDYSSSYVRISGPFPPMSKPRSSSDLGGPGPPLRC